MNDTSSDALYVLVSICITGVLFSIFYTLCHNFDRGPFHALFVALLELSEQAAAHVAYAQQAHCMSRVIY